jgi:hypothetical protein
MPRLPRLVFRMQSLYTLDIGLLIPFGTSAEEQN